MTKPFIFAKIDGFNFKLIFMEDYIQISKLNDFLFCPKTLYLHAIYESFGQKTYHQTPQVAGKIKHENIDEGRYSTAKKYLQGIEIASEEYGILGKIDIYDQEAGSLIERKNIVKNIYEGYLMQVWAQTVCLEEMGYSVKNIFIHSLSDNKRYPIDFPGQAERARLKDLIQQIRDFNPLTLISHSCPKCALSIYGNLNA